MKNHFNKDIVKDFYFMTVVIKLTFCVRFDITNCCCRNVATP